MTRQKYNTFMRALIKIENLTKSFNKNIVIDGLHLLIDRPSINLIVGSNGCGKTTLLKIILNLLQSYQGNVTIHGQTYGMLNSNYISSLTGEENIKYFLPSISYESCKILINKFKMEDYILRSVKNYSLGMKQRLSIVIALLHSYDILLLDEPMNGLDIDAKIVLRNIFLDLKEKGKTIIIVSHNIEEIVDDVDNIFHMKDGKLEELSRDSCINYYIEFKNNILSEEFKTLLETYNFTVNGKGILVYNVKDISEVIRKTAALDIVQVKKVYKFIGSGENENRII